MGKIISLSEVSEWRRGQGSRTVVATNGCFDILHVGHLRYLQAARRMGDVLVVGLNGDDSVRALKGEVSPINGERERAELLAALEVVDCVVIFPEKRAVNFLTLLKPDVYVKGGDYSPDKLDEDEVAAVVEGKGRIEILPLVPGRSTSNVVERIVAQRLGKLDDAPKNQISQK